jgi:hypothetical protein
MDGFWRQFWWLTPEALAVMKTIWIILTSFFAIAGIAIISWGTLRYISDKGKLGEENERGLSERQIKSRFLWRIIGGVVLATITIWISVVLLIVDLIIRS